MAIKFNKHHVTNGTVKVRCWYSVDNHISGRKCVGISQKDYGHGLFSIFPGECVNNTDTQTDYFDKSRVTLYEDHPHYAAARTRAEAIEAEYSAKRAARERK
jgi:hypothetical protein